MQGAAVEAAAAANLDKGGASVARSSRFGGGKVLVKNVETPTVAVPSRVTPREPDVLKALIFRSDSDLWPAESGGPRPILPNVRVALRRLQRRYGEHIQESEADAKQALQRAETYMRACDASKALRAHAEHLQKENSKVQKEWAKAVEELLVALKVESSSGSNSKGLAGKALSEDGLAPVQVEGQRWYCASLRNGLPLIDRCESPEKTIKKGLGDKLLSDKLDKPEKVAASLLRHMGPLRKTIVEAAVDLKRMRETTPVLEETAPEEKRRRMAKVTTVAGG